MILTVTLNTALDITYRVRSLRPHASHRVSEVTERPGGKGVNVARVLAALGHEVTVTGFTGAATGRVVQERLAAVPGLADALVPVSGATRRTIAVVDEHTGDTTQLNEPGPTITPAEWSAFQEAYADLLHGVSAVALCGSLPPGVPVGAYAGLVRTARAAGVPVLLDTGGEPLRRGVAARPDIIKPNADELAGRVPRPGRSAGSHPRGPLAGHPTGPPARQSDRGRRRGGGGPAVGPGGTPPLAGPPDPGHGPVGGDGAGTGGRGVRPGGVRGTAGEGGGDAGGQRGLNR